MERLIKPSVKDLVTALKSCATETSQSKYPCEGCYLYPFSKDGHMSTGRTCFEHLALEVVSKLNELNDFQDSQCAKLLADNSHQAAQIEALDEIKKSYIVLNEEKAKSDNSTIRTIMEDNKEIERLTAKVDALEAELVKALVLPCELGADVWRIVNDASPHIVKDRVEYFTITKHSRRAWLISRDVDVSEFGKTVFLTREAAEAALQEGTE